MNAVTEAREKAEQLAQERQRGEERWGGALRALNAVLAELGAADVDDPGFAALVARRDVERARIEVLEARVQIIRMRADDARNAWRRIEARAAAAAVVPAKREMIGWEP